MLRHLIQMPALLLLSMAALAGCARKEALYEPAGRHEVHFRAHALEVNPDTKGTLPQDLTIRVAVYRRTGATPDPNSDTFIASNTYNVLAGGSLTACTVNPDGTVGAGAGEQLVVRNGTYDFYAYGSATPLTGNTTVEGITHGRDFIAGAVLNKTVSGATTILLDFEHLCTQVQFNVVPEEGLEVTSLSASKVTLSRMATSPASYTPGGAIAPTVGNTEVEITSFTNAADGKSTAAGMILLPKSEDTFEIAFDILLNGAVKSLQGSITQGLAFEAGKHYIFKAIVRSGEVEVTLTVLDWEEVDMDGDLDYPSVSIGTWGDIDWNADMGNDTGNIGNWTENDWSSDMGNDTGNIGNWTEKTWNEEFAN